MTNGFRTTSEENKRDQIWLKCNSKATIKLTYPLFNIQLTLISPDIGDTHFKVNMVRVERTRRLNLLGFFCRYLVGFSGLVEERRVCCQEVVLR